MNARQELAAKFRAAILETVERVPVSEVPDEGTQSCIDDGARRIRARFRRGEWVRSNGQALPAGFVPTHWVRIRK